MPASRLLHPVLVFVFNVTIVLVFGVLVLISTALWGGWAYHLFRRKPPYAPRDDFMKDADRLHRVLHP